MTPEQAARAASFDEIRRRLDFALAHGPDADARWWRNWAEQMRRRLGEREALSWDDDPTAPRPGNGSATWSAASGGPGSST